MRTTFNTFLLVTNLRHDVAVLQEYLTQLRHTRWVPEIYLLHVIKPLSTYGYCSHYALTMHHQHYAQARKTLALLGQQWAIPPEQQLLYIGDVAVPYHYPQVIHSQTKIKLNSR